MNSFGTFRRLIVAALCIFQLLSAELGLASAASTEALPQLLTSRVNLHFNARALKALFAADPRVVKAAAERITHLTLRLSCDINDLPPDIWVKFSQFRRLVSLKLAFDRPLAPIRDGMAPKIGLMRKLPELKSLDVSEFPIVAANAKDFAESLATFPKLSHLAMDLGRAGPEYNVHWSKFYKRMKALKTITHFRYFETVELDVFSSQEAFDVMGHWPLEHLSLDSIASTGVHWQFFSLDRLLPRLQSLKSININSEVAEHAGMGHIWSLESTLKGHKGLEDFSFKGSLGTFFLGGMASALCNKPRLHSLTFANASSLPLEGSLVELIQSGELLNLRTLDLSGTKLNDDKSWHKDWYPDVSLVEVIPQLSKLHHLSLGELLFSSTSEARSHLFNFIANSEHLQTFSYDGSLSESEFKALIAACKENSNLEKIICKTQLLSPEAEKSALQELQAASSKASLIRSL